MRIARTKLTLNGKVPAGTPAEAARLLPADTWVVATGHLHPDTEPAAIAAAQRAAIRGCGVPLADPPDVAAVAAAVVLPASVVERRLAEMGLLPRPRRPRPARSDCGPLAAEVRRLLAAREMSTPEITAATGATPNRVRHVLTSYPEFRVVARARVVRGRGKAARVWGLRAAGGQGAA